MDYRHLMAALTLILSFVLAGCADNEDAKEAEASQVAPGLQAVQLTQQSNVDFVEITPPPPRPEATELFNESWDYSPGADLPNFEFEVDEDWYYVRYIVSAGHDAGATPQCGALIGDPTDGENWSPQGYLDTGHMPTSGVWITTPSGYKSWKPYHSGTWCETPGQAAEDNQLREYHVFTGEQGTWKVVQSGRGVGVWINIAVLGTDELPEAQGGSTATI